MTPQERLHQQQRTTTPKLVKANLLVSIGALVSIPISIFLAKEWMVSVNNSIKIQTTKLEMLTANINERRVLSATWKAETNDKIAFIYGRLDKVEKKVFDY